jgi:hypothetical protein
MAIVQTNALISGFRGKLGANLVLRVVRGKTIASTRAKRTETQSEQQRENRTKFKRATMYAKAMMLDPQKKTYYQHKAKKLNLPNAYTAAITDYMREPRVQNIKVKEGTKAGGQRICIHAGKAGFSIASVKVSIVYHGIVLEEGIATHQNNVDAWVFHITTTAPSGSKVVITVKDWTGNTTTAESLIL